MSENKNVNTYNENSANDTYIIIENKTGTCLNIDDNNCCKLAYRKNLLEILNRIFPDEEFSNFSAKGLYDVRVFRKFVAAADEKGYSIYQLTRL